MFPNTPDSGCVTMTRAWLCAPSCKLRARGTDTQAPALGVVGRGTATAAEARAARLPQGSGELWLGAWGTVAGGLAQCREAERLVGHLRGSQAPPV